MSSFLGYPVSTYPAGTRTAADAAAAIGCDVAQIVKPLVFRKRSGGALLVLASGRNRVDEAKVGALVAEPISKADEEHALVKTPQIAPKRREAMYREIPAIRTNRCPSRLHGKERGRRFESGRGFHKPRGGAVFFFSECIGRPLP